MEGGRKVEKIRFFFRIHIEISTLGTRGFLSRASGCFALSAAGRIHEGHFLRLERNRKPRMKSLWHPGGE